jgi:hypothetical protein
MKSLWIRGRSIEILIYVLIWALVFSVPFFNLRGSGHPDWNNIAIHWLNLSGFLLVFLVNVYILVPRFLLQKRYLNYFVLISVIILLVIAVKIFILITGAGTTIRLMSKWLVEEKMRKDAEKEQLKTNLALLRHQVSPHFFMNTLNNIHSLIETDTKKAQDAVVRLSTLMRYLLVIKKESLKLTLKFHYENLHRGLVRFHRVPRRVFNDRIVCFHQPHVGPVVRGKTQS